MSAARPARAITVDPDATLLDGERTAELPDGLGSLPNLLARVSRVFRPYGEGVLVLTRDAMDALDFPAELPRTGLADHPLLTAPRAAGWRVSALGPWTTFWRPERSEPAVHVLAHPWRRPDAPLPLEDPWEASWYLRRYAELAGGAYHATAGVAGLGLLRDRFCPRSRPFWTPPWKAELLKATRNAEADLLWSTSTTPAGGHLHTYDANVMYLSAAALVEVASGELKHTGAIGADPSRPGYWRIGWPAWNLPHVPNPLGWRNRKGSRSEAVWITSPTLKLLCQLAEEGLTGAPEIRDSWTADTGHRVLRTWAEQLGGAIDTARESAEPGDDRVLPALKATYREAVGMLDRDTGRMHRPDWRHAVIGLARANLWRKVWRVGTRENRWPVQVKTDAVTYWSDQPDPALACPVLLQLGTGRGEFKIQPPEAAAA